MFSGPSLYWMDSFTTSMWSRWRSITSVGAPASRTWGLCPAWPIPWTFGRELACSDETDCFSVGTPCCKRPQVCAELSVFIYLFISSLFSSEAGLKYLQVLSRLLCSSNGARPTDGTIVPTGEVIANISSYLIRRDFFVYLGSALGQLVSILNFI